MMPSHRIASHACASCSVALGSDGMAVCASLTPSMADGPGSPEGEGPNQDSSKASGMMAMVGRMDETDAP